MRCASLCAFLLAACIVLPAKDHLLLQRPATNGKVIVFQFAGDLWSVPRDGGLAIRLTTGVGIETGPAFSPDGATVAFTGEYDGNIDVFTMPVSGGIPKRLTYHPGNDYAVGWTTDGRGVIFSSNRESSSPRYSKLFIAPLGGGLPTVMPLPMGNHGVFSADGKRFAYSPVSGGSSFDYARFVSWRRYRGGLASSLLVVSLPDLSTTKVPRETSSDFNPVWVNDNLYFLSDRSGPVTLFRFDPSTGKVTEILKNDGHDLRSASGGPDGIVYDQFGKIFWFDVRSGSSKEVPINIVADFPEVRSHLEDVSREVRNARISATGMRAVVEAHGEILTIPASKGDYRNITSTPGVMERSPAWAPDGEHIAYFSDESGLYALHIGTQTGAGPVKKFPLLESPTYYSNLRWSPDSKHVAFTDNKLELLWLNTETGKLTKVDTDLNWGSTPEPTWSPDSRWIAYTRSLPNRLHALFLFSLDTGRSTQVTDGMSDVRFPAFDRDGGYLYFTASTNYGPATSGLDMSSDEHDVTRGVYGLVLSKDAGSPLPPESDEEKASPGSAAKSSDEKPQPDKPEADKPKTEDTSKPQAKPKPKPVHIDLENLQMRVVPFPLPFRNYADLRSGKAGTIFVLAAAERDTPGPGRTLSRFDTKSRKTEKVADNLAGFDVSADGEKLLVQMMSPSTPPSASGVPARPVPQFAIIAASGTLRPGEGQLRVAGTQVRVDPKTEWKQMYHEVWRIERSFFYDPKYHGVDTVAAEKQFAPYLEDLQSRVDLNYVFQEMLGSFTVGHLRGGGGTIPTPPRVDGGLLGADYEIVDGRYRIKQIYQGGPWDPQVRAPLHQPGLKVKTGDFILAINGQELKGTDDISRLLEGTAGKAVVLRLASNASGADSHEISAVPTASESSLRNLAWIQANQKKVDQMSGGKLAYVYLPDTAFGGLTNFNRYYFAQTDRPGAIIDERFNSGGQAADYIIQSIGRELLNYWAPRYGAIYKTPAASIQGPKVMVINEFAGSGGDAMPWYFRYAKLGPLVGKRTWGGLVGVSGYPDLMDGGNVTSPSFGFFTPSGQWEVENHGVAPDIEVDLDPKAVAEGHDPQLERAVQIAMSELERNPPPQPRRPAYPNYNRQLTTDTRSATAGGSN